MTSKTAVRARADASALLKAPRMFDQGLDTIASELIQNSRRAGSTRVAIRAEETADGTTAWFEDDGRGIEDLQALITFGRSDWNEAVRQMEDVGGVGAFCLASRGCVVRSRGQKVTLTPGTFAGTEDAEVEDDDEGTAGTSIGFPLIASDGNRHQTLAERLRDAISIEARHCPIQVAFDGERVGQAPFLHGWTPIGRLEDADVAITREKGHRRGERGRTKCVSFYGHLATAPDDLVARTLDEDVNARWEVVEGSKIRLTLPTRDRVVDEKAWRALYGRTKLAACRTIASPDATHRLSMPDVAACRAAGIDVSLPEVALHAWTQDVTRWRDPDNRRTGAMLAGAIIAPSGLPTRARMQVAMLVEDNPALKERLCSGENLLTGHPDYDAMPWLQAVCVAVTMPDGEVITERHDIEQGKGKTREQTIYVDRPTVANVDIAERIETTLEFAATGGPTHRLSFDVECCLIENDDDECSTDAYVARKATDETDAIARIAGRIGRMTSSSADEEMIEEHTNRREEAWIEQLTNEMISLSPQGAKMLVDRMLDGIQKECADWVDRRPRSAARRIEVAFDDCDDDHSVVAMDDKGNEVSEAPIEDVDDFDAFD